MQIGLTRVVWWLIYAISCFRVFAPKGERRRHENTKWHKSATIGWNIHDVKYVARLPGVKATMSIYLRALDMNFNWGTYKI